MFVGELSDFKRLVQGAVGSPRKLKSDQSDKLKSEKPGKLKSDRSDKRGTSDKLERTEPGLTPNTAPDATPKLTERSRKRRRSLSRSDEQLSRARLGPAAVKRLTYGSGYDTRATRAQGPKQLATPQGERRGGRWAARPSTRRRDY
jgi:hypothetical protein